jgi:hypothetical protein
LSSQNKLKFKQSNYNYDEKTIIVIKTAAATMPVQKVFTE